jgi:hypothetical protein
MNWSPKSWLLTTVVSFVAAFSFATVGESRYPQWLALGAACVAFTVHRCIRGISDGVALREENIRLERELHSHGLQYRIGKKKSV